MTEEDQSKIIELFKSGWSIRRISAHTGYSRSSVQRVTGGMDKDELVHFSSASAGVIQQMHHSTPPPESSSVSLGEIVVAVACLAILAFVFYPLLSLHSH